MLKRIGIQFIVTVGTATVAVILVFAFFLISIEKKQILQAKIESANQLSETIKKSTEQDMMANRLDNVYLIIRTIGGQEGIEKVRIFEKTGEIIFSTIESEIGSKVDMKTEACYVCHASGKPLARIDVPKRSRIFKSQKGEILLGMINPIYNEKGCSTADCHYHPPEKQVLGVLDITMSLSDVESELSTAKNWTIAGVLAAFLCLCLFIYLFMQSRILVPVNRLLLAMKRVSTGRLDVTVETKRQDEIGALTQSFNEMTKRLSEAQTQISQQDKLASVGRLAAGVAHEINNPLTGVLTYASFLLKRAGDSPELRDDLEVIVRETKRCRSIVRGLLDFSRQSSFKKEETDINEVVSRSIEVLANQLGLHNVKLSLALMGDPRKLVADRNQLQQVVVNLVLNAIDAVLNGGNIEIATKAVKVAPLGNAQIRRAECPAGCILIDERLRIRSMPAITVAWKDDKERGVLDLDPVYGSANHVYASVVKPGRTLDIHCPKCDLSLVRESLKCTVCGAPLFWIKVPGAGQVLWCTRRGCQYQRWDHVESQGAREYVEVSVKDDGIGMNADTLAMIFEPFFTTKGNRGTGLGLSVSWGIVRNHGGTIDVESDPGAGSTFTIRLPVELREEDAL